MKKLFVSLMAIAALVSCSKEDDGGIALDSKNKSIAITIVNSGAESRVGVTNKGVTGNAVAEANTMDILFADASGTILKVLDLVAGTNEHKTDPADNLASYAPGASTTADGKTTYVWHNVPAAVTQVAIVRDTEGDVTITPGTTKLENVKAAADDEDVNLNRSLDKIFLYGEDLTLTSNGDCVVVDGIEYKYYLGEVRVAPLFARFEINSIQCTDLGDDNKDTDINTFGFDELYLKSLVWNTTTKTGYNIPVAADATILGTLWGSYNPATGAYDANTNTTAATRYNYLTADMKAPASTEKVWSWNIMPATFKDMKLVFGGAAYDYALADKEVELNVTGLAAEENATAGDEGSMKWQAEHIYRVDLKFVENNLGGKSGLCVQVKVEIATWTVNTVYPVFGTTGGSNAQ